jgi:uncharacterized membrane protein YbaN (DUF454 family)
MEMRPTADKKIIPRIKKMLLLVSGTVFVGIGFIGIIIPVLPTTPFLLLAALCYIRGSEKMYFWLISNKIFGSFIKNYYEGKGITVLAKIATIILLWVSIIISVIFMIHVVIIQIIVICVAAAVTTHILLIKTNRQKASYYGIESL